MVTGVSQVTVQGGAKYAVRIQVDPEKLETQKIGINEIPSIEYLNPSRTSPGTT